MERVKPTVRRGDDRTTNKPEGLSEERRGVGTRYHCVGTAGEHEKKRSRAKMDVCLPGTESVVENLDLGHEAGEGRRMVAVPREELGQLVSPRRGKSRDGHGLEGSSAGILPSPRRAGDAQTLGVDRLFSLVVSVSSGFVRCRSSRMHRCMQHQIEPSMEQISSGGRQDLNVQLR